MNNYIYLKSSISHHISISIMSLILSYISMLTSGKLFINNFFDYSSNRLLLKYNHFIFGIELFRKL